MFPPPDPQDRPVEFWEEEEARLRRDYPRMLLRLLLIFGGLILALVLANWWAGSAVHFSDSRVQQTTRPTYVVGGRVTDARTGKAIPWAEVSDDPDGHPPVYATRADHDGNYELLTIAEPHTLHIRALGYRQNSARIGRPWYLWAPAGHERLDVKLESE